MAQAFVVVVNRYCQRFFCVFLTDNVVVERLATISAGVGSFFSVFSSFALASSFSISPDSLSCSIMPQVSTHSLQMKACSPSIRFLTSFSDFPQNEQVRFSSDIIISSYGCMEAVL